MRKSHIVFKAPRMSGVHCSRFEREPQDFCFVIHRDVSASSVYSWPRDSTNLHAWIFLQLVGWRTFYNDHEAFHSIPPNPEKSTHQAVLDSLQGPDLTFFRAWKWARLCWHLSTPMFARYIRWSNYLDEKDIIHNYFILSHLSEAHLVIAIYICPQDPYQIFLKMRFTLAIPIAMAAVAIALPQGPGGSQAIVGWCVSILASAFTIFASYYRYWSSIST